MTDLVLRSDQDGAATLSLNRPDKLNALNVEVFAELERHVDDLERQTDTIGVVILRGAGRCFSAGHDLGDISTGEVLPKPHFQSTVIERLANLPQPVITATQALWSSRYAAILSSPLRVRSSLTPMRSGR